VKRFKNEIKLIDNKPQTFLCLVVGIIAAIIFFYFLLYLYEIIHLLEVAFTYNGSATISVYYRLLLNLTCGVFSVLLGNSVFLALRFQRFQFPKTRRSQRILNDLSFGFPSFLHFAIKYIFLFGIYILAALKVKSTGVHLGLLSLVFLVYYFETMKTISSLLGKNRFKVIIKHIFVLVGCISLLTFVNLSKFSHLEKKIEKATNHVKLVSFSYPDLDSYTFNLYYYSNFINLSILPDNELPYSYWQKERDLSSTIKLVQDEFEYYKYSKPTLALWIDKRVKMGEVISLRNELMINNITNIRYHYSDTNDLYLSAKDVKLQYSKSFYDFHKGDAPLPPKPEIFLEEKITQGLKKVDIDLDRFSSVQSNLEYLVSQIKPHLEKQVVINLVYSNDTSFQIYLKALKAFDIAKCDFIFQTYGVIPLKSTEHYERFKSDIEIEQLKMEYQELTKGSKIWLSENLQTN